MSTESDAKKKEEEEEVSADRLKTRIGIGRGLKNLSRDGKLNGDYLKEARGRATEAGVTDGQFNKFLGDNLIRQNNTPATPEGEAGAEGAGGAEGVGGSPPADPNAIGAVAPVPPASTPEEATQNVVYQRNFGTGLDQLDAMQDPNYELGSGSALSEPARPIGNESGKYRRASRRLRRAGHGAAASQMALEGEKVRMGEPAINSEANRKRKAGQRIATGREAQKQDQEIKANDQRIADYEEERKKRAKEDEARIKKEAEENAKKIQDEVEKYEIRTFPNLKAL